MGADRRAGRCRPPAGRARAVTVRRARAALDWLHLHDLRHAFATFLLDQGEELRTVMELLGHSTIRMTADTYGHVLPARARQAASAMTGFSAKRGRRDRLGCTRDRDQPGKVLVEPRGLEPLNR
ncbi:tyrosine-type recombinase/integrase [Micromonospora sp. NPDC050276]|uniref:tyrosine-type recombinase/integrase n=1 Tax=Micromonospora sp. NPDC050276 TaxID=3364278 RepID=UPI0037A78955